MEKENENHAPQVSCCDWKDKYMALEKRVARMQKEMDELKKKIAKDSKEVRGHCQYFYKKDVVNKKELSNLKEKVETLSNVVIRLEQQFQETSAKLVDMQARSMRRNLIISGLEEPKNETAEQLKQAVVDFCVSKLKVQEAIPFKAIHRLNYVDGSEYRPVIIKLANIDHKPLLLSHGPNLKGLQNNKKRYYYLNEQLPDRLSEDKRYAQMWITDNKNKPTNDQLQMKIYKNKLRINNTPYQRKVKPPLAAEILRLDQEELETVKQAPTVFGGSQFREGSEFISYAAKVSTVEEVRIAYRKLRVKYADAAHIISAYRLAPANGPFNQEANDDGEHGAGRMVLNLLQQEQVTGIAVFLIRFYGGKHLGGVRFDIMKSLARKALVKAGFRAESDDERIPVKTRRQTRSMSQRGRGGVVQSGSQRDVGGILQGFSQAVGGFTSMFRPTPASSPAVSPSNDYKLALDGGAYGGEEEGNSQVETEEDDLMSANEFEDTSAQELSSHHNSEADDEDE